jgi:hypothetical protein
VAKRDCLLYSPVLTQDGRPIPFCRSLPDKSGGGFGDGEQILLHSLRTLHRHALAGRSNLPWRRYETIDERAKF